MAKFNSKSSTTSGKGNTTNLAGGPAYKQSDKLAFASLLLTSLVQAQFYRSEDDQLKAIKDLVAAIPDKKFLAKTAIYARNEFGMRSITHVAIAEIVRSVKNEPWVKSFIQSAIRRPDDMTETLSYYINTYGKPVPNAMKRGLAKAFDKFNGYQLAKYRGEGRQVSLVDVVNLVHPKPVEKNQEALKMLVNDTLRSTETWESMLSKAGEEGTDKGDAWKQLLAENKLGYFAALRNINNVMKQGDDATFKLLMDLLVNADAIKKSLVFPYRYLTALKNLDGDTTRVRAATSALSKAVDIACSSVPMFPGTSLVVVDYSGSMGEGLNSHKGTGSVFGAVLAKACNADFMIFGDNAAYVNYDPNTPTIKLAEDFMKNNQGSGYSYSRAAAKIAPDGLVSVGHGTNFSSIFQTANKKYDRVFIFSDMQGWASGHTPEREFTQYKQKYTSSPKIYSFDLSGYGTAQFRDDVFCIPGFSDKIFDVLEIAEKDKSSIVDIITAVEFE